MPSMLLFIVVAFHCCGALIRVTFLRSTIDRSDVLGKGMSGLFVKPPIHTADHYRATALNEPLVYAGVSSAYVHSACVIGR